MTTTDQTPITKRHPAREYVDGIPDALRWVWEDLTKARASALYLWPFVWRATLSDAVENAGEKSFELGRWKERHDAEERRQAPALASMVKCMREEWGLSVEELAALSDFDIATIESVESGEVAPRGFASRIGVALGEYAAEKTRSSAAS